MPQVVLAAEFLQRRAEIAAVVDQADGGFTGEGGNGGIDENTGCGIGGHAGRRGGQGSAAYAQRGGGCARRRACGALQLCDVRAIIDLEFLVNGEAIP